MNTDEDRITPKKRAQKVREHPPEGWRNVFLEALANTGNVRASCRRAEVSHPTVYDLYESDPLFKAQWSEALELATDLLEYEARKRAMGTKTKDETKHTSDTLMIFLLKAHRPEKFDPQRAVNALLQQIADNTAPKLRPE